MTTVVVKGQRQDGEHTFLNIWANGSLQIGERVSDRYGREMEILNIGEPTDDDCVTVEVHILEHDTRMTLEEYEVLHRAAVELYTNGETDQRCPHCGGALKMVDNDGYDCTVRCTCGLEYQHSVLD